MSSENQVVRLAPEHYELAARVLARAFHSDPHWNFVVPDPAERARVMPGFFRWFVAYADLIGEPLATAGIPLGAALWFRGDSYHGSEELFARITVPTPGDALGSDPARRFWSSVARLEEIHAHEVPGSHWYLPFLGVEPGHQGRGLGGALLHAMVERAARERLACYLESFQPRNIEFYRRHGFGLVAHEFEPVSRLPFWTFRLDP